MTNYNLQKLWEGYKNYSTSSFTSEARSIEKGAWKRLEDLAKEQKPRFRKWDRDRVVQVLGSDFVEKFFEDQKHLVENYYTRRKRIKEKLKKLVLSHVDSDKETKPLEAMIKVKESSIHRFTSQGWGSHKYAKCYLVENKLMLEELGYKCLMLHNVENNSYDLYANISEIGFWIITSKYFYSVEDWAVICWKYNVNPKVYFPFLSDKDYNESMRKRTDPKFKPLLREYEKYK